MTRVLVVATGVAAIISASQAQSCSLVDGIDLVGNDIASAQASVATDCCAKCSAESGCTAFTWTNWNGGTCWLKSKRGTAVSMAGARSSGQVIPPSCAIENGVDYIGNDVGNAPGTQASDCCAQCRARPGCGAFSWTNWNGGTCWLKSAKGATVLKAGVSSSVLSTQTCLPTETGVDYIGNDIASVAGASASDCCSKCAANAKCGAFTWTSWNSGTCWLKSKKGATKLLSGAISAEYVNTPTPTPTPTTPTPTTAAPTTPKPTTTAPPPAQCNALEVAIDYVANDIGSAATPNATDCCTKCGRFSGCWAFTWSDWNGGTCWFKSGKGTTRLTVGVVSGTLVGAPTPAPTTVRPIPPRPTTVVPPPSNHVQWKIRSGVIPARSVNLGSWLVGEYWMSKASPAWKGVDNVTASHGEFVTMQTLGKTVGTAQFEEHRTTWLTDADIMELAAAGVNSVRVPVGFWIMYDDPAFAPTNISQVYAAGSLKYLDTLINTWAVTHNIAVIVSLHAHQGSQNGYDHSGPQTFGQKNWFTSQANVDNSLAFATFIAARYKTSEAFLGLNLMNEPSVPTPYDILLGYYTEAYKRIRATGNDCIIVTSPRLEEQSPDWMQTFMPTPDYYNVWHEFHPYFIWGYEGLQEPQIIQAAQNYRQSLDRWNGNPLYLSEWCVSGPDSAPFANATLRQQFAAAQLATFEAATAGWAFWSWRMDVALEIPSTGSFAGWSMRQMLRDGIFKVPVSTPASAAVERLAYLLS